MTKPSILRIAEFQKLLQQFAQIERVIHRSHKDSMVLENDTEHSYNLTMTAWFLADYFPNLNKDLVIRFALVHDLVEVHAGDTYVYADPKILATKVEREVKAFEQLKADWSDFPEMIEYIENYEHRHSEESKFVYALDKILPILTIYINEGYTWKQEGITLERLNAIKEDKVKVAPEIEPYYQELYKILLDSPQIIPPN